MKKRQNNDPAHGTNPGLFPSRHSPQEEGLKPPHLHMPLAGGRCPDAIQVSMDISSTFCSQELLLFVSQG